jgi:hypothetical protein
MFILVFSVSFGIKKSILITYSTFWNFNYYFYSKSFFYKFNNLNKTLFYSNFRFQFTSVTSLLTSYILFFFWIFFFFFGEFLLLLLFNFSTISDSMGGSYFFNFKNFIIFDQSLLSNKTNDFISFFILFFTSSAFLFLLNLRYTFFYKYFKISFFSDFFFVCILSFFFNFFFLLPIFFFLFKK